MQVSSVRVGKERLVRRLKELQTIRDFISRSHLLDMPVGAL